MRELPILFSTDMVKAILDGRKTMTRRVVKVANPGEWEATNDCRNSEYGASVPCYISRKVATEERGVYYPRYDVGDRLYVKESIKRIEWVDGIDGIAYVADDEPAWDISRPCRWVWKNKTLPSMFMPQGLARIWLEVTDVRVERLNEITEEDAIKEGVRVGIGGMPYFSCQDAFPALWDSTIKNQDLPLYGWDSNCWVWVYEFKRLEGYR